MLLFGRREEAPLNDRANVAETNTPEATPRPSVTPTATVIPTPASSPNASSETLAVPLPDIVPFEKRLEDLATCLKLRAIKASEESENLDFFSLNSSLTNKFGGIKNQADLWASTEIQTSTGVRRRLFADFRQGQPSLRYLEVQKDGSQKNIELTAEQMTEPSESLIASLESDGQILGRVRERLISYQYGQKIQVREVDGNIYSFKVTQGNKTFSCDPGPQKQLNCGCSEQ
ncbi:hypothetical protein D3C87_1546480 [compost metagenome]